MSPRKTTVVGPKGPTTATTGWCQTAQAIEAGTMASKSTPDDFHRGCPGATRLANGEVFFCACDCHPPAADRPIHDPAVRCPDCNSDLPVGQHDCADVLENPTMVRVKAARAESDRIRAEIAEAEAKDRAVGGGGGSRPRSGTCEHCGEPTKGGRFLPGHDAKLKGELQRNTLKGDEHSCAELKLREWPVPNDVGMGVLREAEQLDTSGDWLARRNQARADDATLSRIGADDE